MPRVRMTVDGVVYEDEVEARLLLAHYLSDKLGMSGTNVGCDTTNCGACTVLVDGQSVKSCTVLALQAEGSDVLTIHGLAQRWHDGDGHGAQTGADPASWHPLQRSFHENHALQCGYCTPGMIMAAVDFLEDNPDPTLEEIRLGLEGNLCRCTGYHNIVRAVKQAADEMRGAASATPREEVGA